MAKNVIINGETYPGVSEVELPISGGTAVFRDVDETPEAPETPEMPSSWWELTGGASSKTGALTATQHGTTIAKPGGGYNLFWVSMDITVDDGLEEVSDNGLRSVSSGLTMHLISNNNFANLRKIGNEAFRDSGLASAVFPEVTEVGGGSGGQFAQCKALTEISLPKLTSWSRVMVYNLGSTNLTTVQIGSIGYPVTDFPASGEFETATAATITIYTTSDKADAVKAAFTVGTLIVRDSATGEVI